MPHPELITSPAEVTIVLELSLTRPVLVFKHSLTCPVSAEAYAEYQRFLAQVPPSDLEHRLIEVQNARAASNAVAEATGIRHESPQALLLADGKVVWNQSHWRITLQSLREALAALP